MSEKIIQLVKNNLNIPKQDVIYHKIKKDGNYWYRVLAKYFTDDENNHKIYRQLIYNAAKNNKESFSPFFLPIEEGADEIIVNLKYDNYIEEITQDKFFAGNIEIAISSILFNLNISIYKLTEQQDNEYIHFTNIWKDINPLNLFEVESFFFMLPYFVT